MADMLIAHVTKVLYFYDQPLLDLLRGPDGWPLLAIAVPHQDDPYRWLAVRLPEDAAGAFLDSRIDCRDVILKHRIGGFLTGSFWGAEGEDVHLVPHDSKVGGNWLPLTDSFYCP